MHFPLKIFANCLKKRLISNLANVSKDVDINKIRNIGISAHIDAGKTTTTERMLYFAGLIQNMGEVHHGNTVTDYMEQERERGITITSAAVTFFWKNHQFNLIDTPGHIDFTMEVEQTLNVLDGVVVILDGSAGVEAQTLTVWRQADRYKIPRIIYVNKMDRPDADIRMCCQSIQQKFEVPAVLLQLPAIEDQKIYGIVDVLSLELMQFNEKSVAKIQLTEKTHPELYKEANQARIKLIEQLSDCNDEMAELVINSGSFDAISTPYIVKVLQKVTLDKAAVAVTLGSSYKNIGVQSLMDSIIHYLPPPSAPQSKSENEFCARAFKVKHDKQKGPLTFTRIYSGSIKKGQKLYNLDKQETEIVSKIYTAYADEFKEMDEISNGNIAVLQGLKKTFTGDLISSRKHSAKYGNNVNIPEPVFFCSIEPPSMATQTALDQALEALQKEDPSLRVHYDTETGQTILGGMGELHLDIIQNRIEKEYKIPAELGPLQIAYKEQPLQQITDELLVETKIGNLKNTVFIRLSVNPVESDSFQLKFDKTNAENCSNIAAISPKHLQAIRQGCKVGFARGPKISSPVINVEATLHWCEVGRGTSDTVITSTVTQLVQKLIKKSGTCVLEPIMALEIIVTSSEYVSVVLADLARRRALVNNVSLRGDSRIISASAPLAELLGYSTVLRTITSGRGSFTAEFLEYQQMTSLDEENAVRSVRGF